VEGGYFAETYRSDVNIEPPSLPGRYTGSRVAGTAIYYLLTPDTFSALHRLRSDEVYHFYLGDPVELLLLRPNGSGEEVTLGPDLAEGMRAQFTVPYSVWQGSRLRLGGRYALLGTTMSPGFDPEDFELGSREELSLAYPAHAKRIRELTRS
jgi:hypothetical protein